MKKIKLSTLEEKKLSDALSQVNMFSNQAKIIQTQLNSASNYQQSILEMIYEHHGIDAKSVDNGTKLNLKDGYLTIGEKSASERIKNDLKKNIKSNGHGKVKA